MVKQDDPRKCTASKLVRFGLAEPLFTLHKIPKRSIVLNPYSDEVLSKKASEISKIIVAIDCSWNKASSFFKQKFKGFNFRLPKLLAANPAHYAHISILSTVEALAAALYILNSKEQAYQILSKFKWGINFITLNEKALKDYSEANNTEEIMLLEREYFGAKNP
ncbi:MAG: DUF367 family protein [Nitrososphaerales archaeon]